LQFPLVQAVLAQLLRLVEFKRTAVTVQTLPFLQQGSPRKQQSVVATDRPMATVAAVVLVVAHIVVAHLEVRQLLVKASGEA
jgi:hypothetical protein